MNIFSIRNRIESNFNFSLFDFSKRLNIIDVSRFQRSDKLQFKRFYLIHGLVFFTLITNRYIYKLNLNLLKVLIVKFYLKLKF